MTLRAFRLGRLQVRPGRLTRGVLDVMPLPTGGVERIPILIAQGESRGPCLWITTGIHGPEHAGLNVVHQVATAALARRLRGTLVVVPGLNPAGLRTDQRRPYYDSDDPNRLFPEGRRKARAKDDDPPSAMEEAYRVMFGWIRATADYLIDLHNAWTGSLPFIFRDRVWYRERKQRARAVELAHRTDGLIGALGLTVINEFPLKVYLKQKLHRSVSGATLNVARIPAITVELGTGLVPDQAIVAACVAGLRNVMRWAGMLDGDPEPIEAVRVLTPPFPIRRYRGPRLRHACIVRHLVRSGDHVRRGDPLAELRDIYGRPVDGGVLRADHDGWVLGLAEGVVRYPGDSVVALAIRDRDPQVAPYPKG